MFQGAHTAHHQELQTVFAASGLYTHVVTGCCPGWVGVPTVVQVGLEFPPSLDNGRSPHGYINQRLQIQFVAPDDEQYDT